MPETHLYLVRHGETDYNRERIMQGRGIDASLNATGRAQAAALDERLADTPLDAIYASSLSRARETAACVARSHPDAPVYTLRDLDEMSWGIYEGQPATSQAVEDIYDTLHAHWDRGEFGVQVDGGESIRDVQQRGVRAVRRIADEHAGGTVCIVAHGRFLRVVLASLLDAYGLSRMDEIPHSNAAVNHLVARSGRFEARFLNCTDHLEAERLACVD